LKLGRGGKCGAAAFSSPPKINHEFGGRARSRPFWTIGMIADIHIKLYSSFLKKVYSYILPNKNL
jgi:hypothetical protein